MSWTWTHMNQSSCDIYEIRGLGAITRILGERLDEPVAYTPQTVQVMRVYVNTLKKILEGMEAKQGADTDPMSDMDRMDRWFVTGFNNLLQYLSDRVATGPPMSEKIRSELFLMMQRMAVDVAISQIRDPETLETADESCPARLPGADGG